MTAFAVCTLPGLLLAAGPQPLPPVFASGVDAVYLDVFVTNRGEPITGLSASDFEVRDNGVLQQASLVELDTVGVTAVLILDTSESLVGPELAQLRAAGHALVDGLTDRDQAALITFSHEVVLQAPATRDRAVLRRALDRLQASGATAVRDALYLGLKLPWPAGRPMIVLFTDGEDNLSWLRAEEILTAARESDVLVNVVAAKPAGSERAPSSGASFDRHSDQLHLSSGSASPERDSDQLRLLRQVATTTGGSVWSATSSGLKAAFENVLAAMRTRYVLSYEPRGVAPAGRHRLRVKVKGRRADVRARSEYTVVPH
jgi:VWFA-related protein